MRREKKKGNEKKNVVESKYIKGGRFGEKKRVYQAFFLC